MAQAPIEQIRRTTAQRVFDRVCKVVPPAFSAYLDHRFKIYPADRLAGCRLGAFNGQERRTEIFHAILRQWTPSTVVETGSYRGTTTEYFARHVTVPVHAVEIAPENYHFCRFRLKPFKNARLYRGNSVDFLKKIAADPGFPKKNVFFYLDAHWYDYLPLRDELAVIVASFSDAVVMIDDFRVPGDAGYGFDDYGPDKRLDLEYLRPDLYPSLKIYFPAAPSADETGLRRGSVVLAAGSAAEAMSCVPQLRLFAGDRGAWN